MQSILKLINRKIQYLTNRYFTKSMSDKIDKTIKNQDSSPKIYLFCAPIHPNLGDQAQTMCIFRWLKKNYPEYSVLWVPMQLTKPDTLEKIKKRITPADLIFIHSGYLTTELYGYLNFMADIARTFKNNKITVFPQTVNIKTDAAKQNIAEAYNSHPNLTLMCRDEVSYESAKKIFKCKLLLYPDFVTSLIGKPEFKFDHKRNGVLMVTRNDKEKYFSDDQLSVLRADLEKRGLKVDHIDTTIRINPFAWIRRRENIIKKYLNLFAQYKVVITDRYHGTIFSQIVGTPTIVIPSNDHKLKSGVKWFPETFDNQIFYIESINKISEKASELANMKILPVSSDWFEDNYWSKLKERIE